MPLASLALLALLQSDGESALRSMLEKYGKLRDVEISFSNSVRDRKSGPMGPGLTGSIAYAAPNRFRYDHAEYWGSGTTYISDGRTLKIAPSDEPFATLRRAGPSLMTSHPALAPGSGSFAFVLLLLEGPKAYHKIVAPGVPIRVRGSGLDFQSKDFGTVSMRLVDGLAAEIQFDNKANRMAAYRFMPMWGDPPEDPLEVESISYRFGARFPPSTFDTRVKPGQRVRDERKPG